MQARCMLFVFVAESVTPKQEEPARARPTDRGSRPPACHLGHTLAGTRSDGSRAGQPAIPLMSRIGRRSILSRIGLRDARLGEIKPYETFVSAWGACRAHFFSL